jgi:hypothetical protein
VEGSAKIDPVYYHMTPSLQKREACDYNSRFQDSLKDPTWKQECWRSPGATCRRFASVISELLLEVGACARILGVRDLTG